MTNGSSKILEASHLLRILYNLRSRNFWLDLFHHVGASLRWQSVGATLSFIALYRGVFFKWMHADKTFRVTRAQYFNGKDWNM